MNIRGFSKEIRVSFRVLVVTVTSGQMLPMNDVKGNAQCSL